MKHIITLNGRYLSNWKERVKSNGGTFIYDLEFTTKAEDARAVEFRDVPTVIIAVRNLVTPRDLEANDDVITYNVVSTIKKPHVSTEVFPFVNNEPVKHKPIKGDSYDAKVEVNLDWLNDFAHRNGLNALDIAAAFGYSGKRIYYGSKVLKGLVRLRYSNITAFAEKYPDIHGHWYFVNNKGGQ